MIVTIVGLGIAAIVASYPLNKFRKMIQSSRKEKKIEREWGNRPILGDIAFDELLNEGKKLSDGYSSTTNTNVREDLLKTVIDHGFRFSVDQIIVLQTKYSLHNKIINYITRFQLTSEIDVVAKFDQILEVERLQEAENRYKFLERRSKRIGKGVEE